MNNKLPESYVSKKFYEYGGNVIFNKGNNTYSCSCPICYEGKSYGKKRRCIYITNNNVIYCHNCGWSSSPLKWIKEVGGLTREDIEREIKSGDYSTYNLDKMSFCNDLDLNIDVNVGLPEDAINCSNTLQLNYYKNDSVVKQVLEYIKKRKLDTAINSCDFYVSLNDPIHKNRLLIPFKNEDGQIIYYQSRAIGALLDHSVKEIKYLSMKGGVRSIFGIDKVKEGRVYITEGPIDACFIENGIAIAGINEKGNNFSPLQNEQISMLNINHEFTWVLDSQWIDETAYRKTIELLKNGWSVFIWPESIGKKYKDFNEVCIKNDINFITHKFIDDNTVSGEIGLLQFKFLLRNKK